MLTNQCTTGSYDGKGLHPWPLQPSDFIDVETEAQRGDALAKVTQQDKGQAGLGTSILALCASLSSAFPWGH